MKHVVIGIDPAAEGSDRPAVAFVRNGQIVTREQVAACAACGEAVCDHSDIDFAGFRTLADRVSLS